MRIHKGGMGLLTICLIAFAVMGCERIIGLDDFKMDGIEGEGDPCKVVLFAPINMEGKCIRKEAPPEDCPGGTFPHDESGDCPSSDKLKCCIFEDQCEKSEMIGLECSEEECPYDGWKMGCPDGQWCCEEMEYEE